MTALTAHDMVGVPDTRRGTWTQTWIGHRLHFLDPQPMEIDPRDIARGLAFQCRFSGQCQYFYSIAQHSVLCSIVAEDDYGDLDLARTMLMHDAQEAYIGDMTRPLKSLMPEYRRVEALLWAAISARFLLPRLLPEAVKEIDNKLLSIEKSTLLPHSEPWPGLPEAEPHELALFGPYGALDLFMQRFKQLFPNDPVFNFTH